ncbi:MAG: uracil-DNA glycosylase [Gammaproteobacteria bacterium]|nr:uracil-DNA glycosylase [Gammaproteobacteria bacterium]
MLIENIKKHQKNLRACRKCKAMIPPVITCLPVASKIILIGQAPGEREGDLGRPFAWTAGKTLFKWFASIGLDEEVVRHQVYIAAVCRCFPGKNPKGGDRVPSRVEIQNCKTWLQEEFELLEPELVILVGKLAIEQFLEVDRLVDVVGKTFRKDVDGRLVDIVPLPHPSGASTWHVMLPGKDLLHQALSIIERHPAWQALL